MTKSATAQPAQSKRAGMRTGSGRVTGRRAWEACRRAHALRQGLGFSLGFGQGRGQEGGTPSYYSRPLCMNLGAQRRMEFDVPTPLSPLRPHASWPLARATLLPHAFRLNLSTPHLPDHTHSVHTVFSHTALTAAIQEHPYGHTLTHTLMSTPARSHLGSTTVQSAR
eukprot:365037-Chlamydomonas_euryale.AAC.7